MKYIGGFFELEQHLPLTKSCFHSNAIGLTSGRACLNLILDQMRPRKIYLPFYSCDTILIPIKQQKIAYEFYAIGTDLLPHHLPNIEKDEAVIWINYFGLLPYPHSLNEQWIIDNTQAFFEKSYQDCWSFNSARKFFGVPDGAYCYAPISIEKTFPRNQAISTQHLTLRLTGDQEAAYQAYLNAENQIKSTPLFMSEQSDTILNKIDYAQAQKIRRDNFLVYANAFKSINILHVELTSTAVPFCYPLLLPHPFSKSLLAKQGIFIPTLWPECITREINGFTFERQLATNLLPLPLDHRYNKEDCQQVIAAILNLLSR